MRVRRFRASANKIPLQSFRARKTFFNDKDNGLLKERQAPQQNAVDKMMMNNPMMDPSNVVEMLKRNMLMIVPQLLIMAGVNYFFSGFVLVKLPFPLTLGFKSMLQRGVDLPYLDMTYVSSLSWYFLILFGLRGIITIFLGENNFDEAKMMQDQMGMNMATMAGPQDVNKVYQSERENLELVKHEWDLENVEQRLLGGNSEDIRKDVKAILAKKGKIPKS